MITVIKISIARILLRDVYERMVQKGYQVGNLDITIMAQAPKMLPYEAQMRANIAQDLHLDLDAVSVKATALQKN